MFSMKYNLDLTFCQRPFSKLMIKLYFSTKKVSLGTHKNFKNNIKHYETNMFFTPL
jgi:hypothetical protein